MARTKMTSNPPPRVDYRALYPWATTLTSSEDVRKHRDGEPNCVGHVFGRESDAYVSVQPYVKGEPVCSDERTND